VAIRRVGWVVALSLVASLAATLLGSPGVEVLCGMAGPLLVAATSWVVAERTYRHHPERLTPVMAAAFGAKMVFFGAYVAVMLKLLSLRPIPFVVSFTAYFIALHLAEAVALKRLFADEGRASR
jgi:hypothetical protein